MSPGRFGLPASGFLWRSLAASLLLPPESATSRRSPAELAAWEAVRYATAATIDWMFDVDRARMKLGRAYPRVNVSESLR